VSEQNRGHERDLLSGLGINAMTAGRAGQTTASTTRAALDLHADSCDPGCPEAAGDDVGVEIVAAVVTDRNSAGTDAALLMLPKTASGHLLAAGGCQQRRALAGCRSRMNAEELPCTLRDDSCSSSLAIASGEAAGSVAPAIWMGKRPSTSPAVVRRLRVDPTPANGRVALSAVRC
jgi:hypothetical protein